ncbi:hypothetical protein SAMN05444166_4661 [Singulisphaera sp. GP187]|uniref:hypothetical protein n=1 Tax=Singulisphaera sp. GP187 TaxID=1882752 RepID=UPI000927D2C7|nr:hypothetical protein [Singulisphaera sp. GP187]SIO43098.1 hypothetical protein SAMN05444166_4661 [Singulisphaera sp. GP187]
MSETTRLLDHPTGSPPKQTWLRFALSGLVGGGLLGGVSVGGEYLLRGRDLYELALPVYLLLYPLIGIGIGWFYDRHPHARTWVRPSGFFSVEPLPPEEADARGQRSRRFMGIGFGAGIAISLMATALDFVWRGWPFLAETLIPTLLWWPYLGLLFGYSMSLQPGASKPSIRNFRFRMRTVMILVAYVALLFGLGTQSARYSGLARIYHEKDRAARAMVDFFQSQIEKSRVDLKRADNAKELIAGRIPDGLDPSQKVFLKGLEGKSTESYKQYRYGLIADGENRQAGLAAKNLAEYGALVESHRKLAAKYAKAAREPWVPVEPDPPMP